VIPSVSEGRGRDGARAIPLSANSCLAAVAMLAPLREYRTREFRGKFRRYFAQLFPERSDSSSPRSNLCTQW